MSSIKISYPLMGNYEVAIFYLLSHTFKCDIIHPPKITTRTAEIGSKYSPDFVCAPFKYTLGTMIESLDKGANVIFQMGGGCRYGYYHELQRKILEDLGYDFKLINLISGGKQVNLLKIFKETNLPYHKIKAIYYGLITIKMVKYIDKIEDYIRIHRCFEVKKNSFNQLHQEMLNEMKKTKSLFHLKLIYHKYRRLFKKIKIKKPKNYIKVGIVGELYTLMEPFTNYQMEQLLSDMGVSVKRFTDVTYLLFKKKYKVKKFLKQHLLKYRMGADALDNIYHTKYLCEHNYDGIIHMKASFCTPEIAAMPIINQIAHEYKVPVLFFSMDMNTSETGVKTRLEAFYDMLEMRQK